MREIKFRVWRQYGERGDFHEISSNYHLDYWAANAGNAPEYPISYYGWEQFTGLLDKNGKEIYEGDILYSKSMSEKYSDNTKWMVRVVFEDASFCMGHGGEALDKDECSRDMEIIGNVHQNQELIKELR